MPIWKNVIYELWIHILFYVLYRVLFLYNHLVKKDLERPVLED